jgi:hypothetical protein
MREHNFVLKLTIPGRIVSGKKLQVDNAIADFKKWLVQKKHVKALVWTLCVDVMDKVRYDVGLTSGPLKQPELEGVWNRVLRKRGVLGDEKLNASVVIEIL